MAMSQNIRVEMWLHINFENFFFFFFFDCLNVFWESAEERLDWVHCFPLLSPRSSDPCAKVMSSATGTRVCLSTPEDCPLWPTAPADLLCVNVFSHRRKRLFHMLFHVCLTLSAYQFQIYVLMKSIVLYLTEGFCCHLLTFSALPNLFDFLFGEIVQRTTAYGFKMIRSIHYLFIWTITLTQRRLNKTFKVGMLL